jgi:hypothetical protein
VFEAVSGLLHPERVFNGFKHSISKVCRRQPFPILRMPFPSASCVANSCPITAGDSLSPQFYGIVGDHRGGLGFRMVKGRVRKVSRRECYASGWDCCQAVQIIVGICVTYVLLHPILIGRGINFVKSLL